MIMQRRIASSRYDETNETVNNILSECSKLAQKEYKSRYDWARKKINWELYKRIKFDYDDRWYMHKLESLLKNEMHKILWDFEMQTDHPIPT